jgi:hypothetical protein
MYQSSRDGRNGWKSLINYYEGESARTRSKQDCYDAISKANYLGPRRNFDFFSYVGIHQQAHQDLVRLGEPVPENKKVRDFLQGINDPQCANIKLNVLSNMTYMNDFTQAVNDIASAIDMTTKNTSTAARQISKQNRSNMQFNDRSRGRGRNGGRKYNTRGRGRGQGRGNGGWGRESDNNSLTSQGTRSYSAQEWQNMMSAQ